MTTPNVRADELSTDDLEDWGLLEPPMATALGDPMPTYGLDLWVSEDESVSTGVWQCEPGQSRWDMEEGEFIHVVSGRMTCTHDDGTEVELSAGSTAVFPTGWSGTWEIHETLRKVYVLFPLTSADHALAQILELSGLHDEVRGLADEHVDAAHQGLGSRSAPRTDHQAGGRAVLDGPEVEAPNALTERRQ